MGKYCLSFFLTMAYLGSAVGVFSSLYLNLHRSSFQELAIESNSTNQEKLLFTAKEFSTIHWLEKGREFEWNGKMYDVSSIEKTKEGYQLYCVNDEAEESFVALFNTWKKSSAPNGNLKFQMQPQFCNALSFLSEEQVQMNRIYFSLASPSYHSPGDRADSPPPELTSAFLF